MKKIISLLLVTIYVSNSFAQTQGSKVSGVVLSKKSALENISVALLRGKDSSVVKMNMSDKNGSFSFNNVEAGEYFVTASGVGFSTFSSTRINVGSSGVQLDTITLSTQSKLLGAINVVAKKPMMEMKADKLVVNVDAAPSNAGNTALEVLEKAPGVSVDKDGNISLKGKQGVMVLIDGKPSYISGADLANMLRGMSESQLDQIEIMTNPPAKYDAAGNAGVINIKTKKMKLVGFNGSVNSSYGQGVYAKTNTGFTFNYRRNKLNIFGSSNYSYRGGYQELKIKRNVIDLSSKAVLFTFDQQAFMPDTRKSWNAKLGIDYDFNKATSASIVFNNYDTRMRYDNNITNKISDGAGNLQTINMGETVMTPHVKNYNLNANLRHKFDSSGTELVIDGAYLSYKDDHKQEFYNSFYNSAGVLTSKPDTLLGHLPTGYNVYAIKADFTKPLTKGSIDMGVKTSFVSSDNNVKFDSIINGQTIKDVGRSNYFIYHENIYAAYANFTRSLNDKWKVQAGLRYEYTAGKGESKTTGATFENLYGRLFPTVYFSYQVDAKNQFSLSYGKRITRPQYGDMNPFILIIDQYTNMKGNPYLMPQFSNNIELSHMYKQFLTTTVNYSSTKGIITDIIEVNDVTKEASVIKRNIAKRNQFGLTFNVQKPLNSSLTFITNASIYHNQYEGIVEQTKINVSNTSAGIWSALQMKFKRGWDAEVNGTYNTASKDGTSMDKSWYNFNLAGSKAILKGKGKVSLNVRDPFALQQYRGVPKFRSVDATVNSRWDNRTVTLSFNYRFGKQFKTNRRSENSASEEQSRIGK